MVNSDKTSTKLITFKSIFAIFLLAALLLADYIVLDKQTEVNESRETVVNIGMRLEKLYLQTMLLAERLVGTQDHDVRKNVRHKLLSTIQLMAAYQKDLMQEIESPEIADRSSSEVRAVLLDSTAHLHLQIGDYLTEVRALVQTPESPLTFDNPHAARLRQMDSNNKLTKALDTLVRHFRQESKAKFGRLINIEFGLLVMNVFMLIMMALFVFPPMINRIKNQNVKLKQEKETLETEIAERRQAEESLLNSQEQLRIFVEHAPAAVAMFDNDMRYLMTSRRWLTDYGLGEREILGLSHYEVFPEISNMTRWKEIHQRCLAGTVETCEEEPFPRGDGTTDWVRWEIHPWHKSNDEIGGIIIFTEVITERKQAEEELNTYRERLEEMVQERTNQLDTINKKLCQEITGRKRTEESINRFFTLSLDMLCIADFDGYFKQLNPAWKEILGYSSEELSAKPYIEFVHPEDKEATLAEAKKLEQGLELIHFENRYFARDGSVKWLSWKASMSVEQNQIYASARDITERKHMEESLRTAKEAAEAATKAKSTFLANMSHELRTPLNSIIGFSEMLCDQVFGDLNERQARYANNIHNSGKHLLELINDILDLSKIEAGRLELELSEFAVEKAVKNAKSIVTTLARKKKIAVHYEIEDSLPPITADEGKFKQILYNLLSNGIKFTPDGGSVYISAKSISDANPPGLEISIRDTGIGIKPEDQKRIFGEFEQIESAYSKKQQGTGLGLALTRKLVEMHGGRIWVQSEGIEGRGSTFTFVIPSKPDNDRHLIESESGLIKPSHSHVTTKNARPHVLVVEDDLYSRELLTQYLSKDDYRISYALDGEQAVQLAKELRPDIITLDILLPTKDGWEVLAELNSLPETKDIPVVIVSVTSERQLGLSLGAVEIFTKPVEKTALLKVIKNIVTKTATASKTILIIDKDPKNTRPLAESLRTQGFDIIETFSAKEGQALAIKARPDVIILDLITKDATGFDIVQGLREHSETREIPILLSNFSRITKKDRKKLKDHVKIIASNSNFEKEDLLKQLENLI